MSVKQKKHESKENMEKYLLSRKHIVLKINIMLDSYVRLRN